MARKIKAGNIVGMVIGLILLIAGGVLVGISPLAIVNSNPYLSTVSTSGVMYGLVFAVGFVVFVAFLHLVYDESKGY